MDYEVTGGGQVKLRASGVVVYSKVPDGKPQRLPDALRAALLPYLQNNEQKII